MDVIIFLGEIMEFKKMDHLLVVVEAIVPKPDGVGRRTREWVHLWARGAAQVSGRARRAYALAHGRHPAQAALRATGTAGRHGRRL